MRDPYGDNNGSRDPNEGENDTDDLHDQLCSRKSFEEVLFELNDEQSHHEFVSAIEGVGRQKSSELEWFEECHLGHIEIGWLWLLWEAYHSDKRPAKLMEGTA